MEIKYKITLIFNEPLRIKTASYYFRVFVEFENIYQDLLKYTKLKWNKGLESIFPRSLFSILSFSQRLMGCSIFFWLSSPVVVEFIFSCLRRIHFRVEAIKEAPNSSLVVHIKRTIFLHIAISSRCVRVQYDVLTFVGVFLIKHTLAFANDCDEDNYRILLRT